MSCVNKYSVVGLVSGSGCVARVYSQLLGCLCGRGLVSCLGQGLVSCLDGSGCVARSSQLLGWFRLCGQGLSQLRLSQLLGVHSSCTV